MPIPRRRQSTSRSRVLLAAAGLSAKSISDDSTDLAVWTGLPIESGDKLLSVENEQLRMLLWTANRSLPTGRKLGLVEAVRYEKAGQPPIPGHSHIAATLDAFGGG